MCNTQLSSSTSFRFIPRLGFRAGGPSFAFALALLAGSAASKAADVVFYSVTKGLKYNQNTAGAPTPGGNPYRFAANADPAAAGSIVSATVAGPVGSPQALAPDVATGWLALNGKSTTEAALNAVAPSGKYTFTLVTAHDGSRIVSVTVPAAQYPAPVHITSANFQAAQAIDPTRPFTLMWDPIPGGTTNDYFLVLLGDAATSTVLFRSPAPLQPNALNGTNASVVIPAGTLQPNSQLFAQVSFAKIQSVDLKSYPGSAGIVGFTSETDFAVTTTASVAPPQFNISFRQFAQGGKFLEATNATASFPATLNGFRVELTVSDDTAFPAANQVLITGPAGSGLMNLACDPAASSINTTSASYFTPKVAQPTTPPVGAWLISYKGTTQTLTVTDPQLPTEVIVPVPKVSLANDLVGQISWTFFSFSGSALAQPPAFVHGLHVQALDSSGASLLDSGALPSGAVSYVVPGILHWSAVNTLRFAYNADASNSYVIGFPHIASIPFRLAAVQDSAATGFVLQLSGEVGRGYTIQTSPDLVNWTALIKTNLTSPTITWTDASATMAPARFYRAELSN
jgi:hypothetical protein